MNEKSQPNLMKALIIVLVIVLVCLSIIIWFLVKNDKNIQFEDADPWNEWDINPNVVGDDGVNIFLNDWEDWNETFIWTAEPDDWPDFIPDFENYSYALAYWGRKPSTGYYIEITEIVVEEYYNSYLGEMHNRFNISVEKTSTGVGGMMIIYASDFVQIPREQMIEHDVDTAIFTVRYG